MTKKLPKNFSSLGIFTDKWLLPSEAERHQTRLTTKLDELTIFYDAMLPRMEDIITHLNGFDLQKLDDENQNLLQLSLSFIEVSTSIEFFKASTVPDGFDHHRFNVCL
ncbi:MAG: hypothetical protein WA142_09690 [Rugosibacter sp.]